VLRLVLAEHELVVSAIVLDELSRVIVEKAGVRPEIVKEVQAFLGPFTGEARPEEPVSAAIADVDDLWVLASAQVLKSEVFVTLDQKVLAVGTVGEMKIVSPRGLWELLRSS
jgi:predicted nucleic acid-binding protein